MRRERRGISYEVPVFGDIKPASVRLLIEKGAYLDVVDMSGIK